MRDKQYSVAVTAGTTGTTDTVNIALGIVRDIKVNNVTNTLYVQTTRNNVGGNQDVNFTLLQAVNGTFTRGLRNITI